jgi:hypothetical protein
VSRHDRLAPCNLAGRARQLVQVDPEAVGLPLPDAFLQQPEPGHVAQEADGPVVPTSLLKPASRAWSVMTGAESSTPASAQVPVQTKAKASSVVGRPTTAGVEHDVGLLPEREAVQQRRRRSSCRDHAVRPAGRTLASSD